MKFTEPELEIVKFSADIIVTSPGMTGNAGDMGEGGDETQDPE